MELIDSSGKELQLSCSSHSDLYAEQQKLLKEGVYVYFGSLEILHSKIPHYQLRKGRVCKVLSDGCVLAVDGVEAVGNSSSLLMLGESRKEVDNSLSGSNSKKDKGTIVESDEGSRKDQVMGKKSESYISASTLEQLRLGQQAVRQKVDEAGLKRFCRYVSPPSSILLTFQAVLQIIEGVPAPSWAVIQRMLRKNGGFLQKLLLFDILKTPESHRIAALKMCSRKTLWMTVPQLSSSDLVIQALQLWVKSHYAYLKEEISCASPAASIHSPQCEVALATSSHSVFPHVEGSSSNEHLENLKDSTMASPDSLVKPASMVEYILRSSVVKVESARVPNNTDLPTAPSLTATQSRSSLLPSPLVDDLLERVHKAVLAVETTVSSSDGPSPQQVWDKNNVRNASLADASDATAEIRPYDATHFTEFFSAVSRLCEVVTEATFINAVRSQQNNPLKSFPKEREIKNFLSAVVVDTPKEVDVLPAQGEPHELFTTGKNAAREVLSRDDTVSMNNFRDNGTSASNPSLSSIPGLKDSFNLEDFVADQKKLRKSMELHIIDLTAALQESQERLEKLMIEYKEKKG